MDEFNRKIVLYKYAHILKQMSWVPFRINAHGLKKAPKDHQFQEALFQEETTARPYIAIRSTKVILNQPIFAINKYLKDTNFAIVF